MKEVRPTSGKVLQALFNILGNMEGRSFLDLFSGTGRVATEALKRGARPVAAVELVPSRGRAVRLLLSPYRDATVLTMDVRRAVDWFCRKGASFDVVFADPPYGARWTSEIGALLFPPEKNGIIAPGGIAVVEHARWEAIPPRAGYALIDCREYGDTVLAFLSAARGEEGS